MAANNYPGRVAPLPIEEFAAFKEFASAKDKSWPCNGSCLWSFLDAAQIATSILYALGQPGLVAGTEDDDALGYWLTILGTEGWREASIRALRLPEEPVENGFSFALDTSSGQGFDLGAWSPPGLAVKQLNKWCLQAVADFYAAREASPASVSAVPVGVKSHRWPAIWKMYLDHVHTAQQENPHRPDPTIGEDESWGRRDDVAISRNEIRAMRRVRKAMRALARP